MNKILEGIKVLDFGRYISCPYCGYILASLGAEVIKVENLRGDDSRHIPPYADKDGLQFHTYNRNKKAISLDFRSPEGRELLKKLVMNADVVIENFKPGSLDKMGIGYDEMSKVKPDLIVASITGYGQKGTYRNRPAFDCVVSAIGGLLSLNGTKEAGPRLIGIPMLDNSAGILNALGVIAALYQRNLTGKGCHVDTAMLDILTSYMGENVPNYDKNGVLFEYAENMDDPYGCPAGMFETKDGYIYIDAGFDNHFRRLRELVGGVLMDDKFLDFNTRLENYALIKGAVSEWVATKTTKEVDDICSEIGITSGPINNIDTVVDGENIRSRDMLKYVDLPTGGKVGFPGMPLKISTMPVEEDRVAPKLGQDTDQILSGLLKMDDKEIKDLHEKGILA